MSANTIPREVALGRAGVLINLLKGIYKRLELAGSIRRQKDPVGNIELVIEPTCETMQHDLFGNDVRDYCLLERRVKQLASERILSPHYKSNKTLISWLKDGAQKRYIAAWYCHDNYILPVDFFIIRPDRLAPAPYPTSA